MDEQRKEFEVFASHRGFSLQTWRDGGYQHDLTKLCWIFWQAATAAEPPQLAEACRGFRDSVLHQRHGMAENGMTTEQVNDVLGLYDDTIGEALTAAELARATAQKG